MVLFQFLFSMSEKQENDQINLYFPVLQSYLFQFFGIRNGLYMSRQNVSLVKALLDSNSTCLLR